MYNSYFYLCRYYFIRSNNDMDLPDFIVWFADRDCSLSCKEERKDEGRGIISQRRNVEDPESSEHREEGEEKIC